MTQKSGIYGFFHKASGRWYIGLSNNIDRRYRQHKSSSKTGENGRFYNAIRAYGLEAFEFVILEECAVEFLPERERFWIIAKDAFYNGFNLTRGGEISPMHCPEVAAKCSDSKKGKPIKVRSKESLIKSGLALRGQKRTAESRAKMSRVQSGKGNGFYGRKWSAEAKAKRTANAAIKRAAREVNYVSRS